MIIISKSQYRFVFCTTILATIFFVTACNAYTLSTPTAEFSTFTQAPSTTPTFVPIQTVVANPDYLQECKEQYPNSAQGPADFLGIDAGKVTRDQIIEYIGAPNQIYDSGGKYEQWSYDGFVITINQNNFISIFVSAEKYMLSLADILDEFGCPNVIFALDTQQEASGRYFETEFVYYNIGVSFTFTVLPVPLDKSTTSISYFRTAPDISAFLVQSEGYYDYPNIAKAISWHEAVNDR